MKVFLKYGLLSFATCLSLITTTDAFAGDRRHDNDNDRGRYSRHDYDRRDNDRWHDNDWHDNGRRGYKPGVRHVVVIDSNDRSVLRQYVRRSPVRAVPVYYAPRYLIGAPLPRQVIYHSVPGHVMTHLRPIPLGYRYIRVDNDILLISVRDNIVWDAVTLI